MSDKITAADVERWMDDNGFFAIERGCDSTVVLYNADADAGARFTRPTLEEACAIAKRFYYEVPSADDVGHKASGAAASEWIRANARPAPNGEQTE